MRSDLSIQCESNGTHPGRVGESVHPSMLWFVFLSPVVSTRNPNDQDTVQSLLATQSDVNPDDWTLSQSIDNSTAFVTSPVPSITLSDLTVDNDESNSSDFDLVEYHIRRYLNHSFSPCMDFFRFTCDYEEIGNNSLSRLSESFYERILASTPPFHPTQIDNDLLTVQEESANTSSFCSIEYSMALTQRCSKQSCFADEFKTAYKVYNFLKLDSTILLQGFNESIAGTASAEQLEHLSTQLHEAINNATSLQTALLFYEGVRERTRVMRRLEGRREILDKALAKTRELAIQMAQGLIEKFNRTHWLHETNLFNLPSFLQFSTILQGMTLRTDLDEEFDWNSTAQSILLEDYLSFYNQSSENNLGSALYTTKFSLIYATTLLHRKLIDQGRSELLFRLTHPLQYAAGNVKEGIVLNAPSFFPISAYLRPESLLGSLGTGIARELVYRFVNPKFTRRSSAYAAEYEGIKEHLEASCEVFDRGAECSLPVALLQEYVSDLEGIRLSYEFMTKSIPYIHLQNQPYSDLPFTSQQLFFISYSVSMCKNSNQLSRERVNSIVQVNGVLSQMPEFAQAFGCSK
ncbi:hypothetical protein PMAYCL1PPCAC_12565, partial [Pristionchus mayeri]